MPTIDPPTTAVRQVRESLAAKVARSLPRLIAMTQALVRVASPNPPGDTVEVAKAAQQQLAAIPGIDVRREEPEPGVVSLVACLRANNPGRRLIFNGHLDTFPIGDVAGWTVPPLGGDLHAGRLYGRGVSDMKGGIACSILAAALLAEHRDTWHGEVVLTLAGDEENMGSRGTAHLLRTVPQARGDACICGDVGSPLVVRFGEKGLLWIAVEACGIAAHGAHVHQGVNAIDRLRRALDRVQDLERLPVAAPANVGRAVAAASAISEKVSGSGETATLGRVTVNIGAINGGALINLVPTRAVAMVDIRLPVGITTAALQRALDNWLAPLEGVSWRQLQRFEANFTDPSHEIVARVRDVAAEVLGVPAAVNMRVGGSDSRWYRMHEVPTVVYGLTPFNMGRADEHILLEELQAVAKVHTLAAFDFLSHRT